MKGEDASDDLRPGEVTLSPVSSTATGTTGAAAQTVVCRRGSRCP